MFKPAATGEVTFSGTASNFTYQLAGGDVADPVVSGSKWNFIGDRLFERHDIYLSSWPQTIIGGSFALLVLLALL